MTREVGIEEGQTAQSAFRIFYWFILFQNTFLIVIFFHFMNPFSLVELTAYTFSIICSFCFHRQKLVTDELLLVHTTSRGQDILDNSPFLVSAH